MKNRLTRLLKVLERCPQPGPGAPDIHTLANEIGATPETIRRDLRDLREAGAFDAPSRDARPANDVEPAALPAGAALPHPPANDGASSHPLVLTDEEFVAMYVGARFLAGEGDPALAAAAQRVIQKIERVATPGLTAKLATLDARYRFGPGASEGNVRQLVAQAIAERRVLSIRYRGEQDEAYVMRDVEPLAQFFIRDKWSFIAYCRARDDIRQFRHDRCQQVQLTEEYFTPRGGFTLEGFLERRRNEPRAQSGAR